ncbi:MAG TPA: class F sortase [Actinomycetes bacterium]|nr:class F sortase [Actinomycetes bacterium]
MGPPLRVLGRSVPRPALAAVLAALLAVAVALGTMSLLGPDEQSTGGGSSSGPSVTAKVQATTSAPSSTPATTSAPATTTVAATHAPRQQCDKKVSPFTPQRITVPGITRGATVISPPRDSGNVPGTPPLTTAGKTMFAWDDAIAPGTDAGNVLLNAHTWPDGTALGNHLLAGLQQGDRIVVIGGSARLCYQVTERVEVLASTGLPRYYDTDGPPQIAIVVCSGRRLGPGNWEKRTVWFASPKV